MIVVGYNDTPDCERALEWAASEARRSGDKLRVVSATAMPTFADAGAGVMIDRQVIEDGAVEMAKIGAEKASALGASDVEPHHSLGNPAEILVEAAEGARVIVLGSRGRGPVLSALLGSVSYAVAAHAKCPVVVVRADAPSVGPQHPIVVGVDDSKPSQRALAMACEVAAERGAPLHLVAVWSQPAATIAAASYVDGAVLMTAGEGIHQAVEAELRGTADRLRTDHPDLSITAEVIEGDPASALAAEADRVGASMLAIGTRGRGGFRGMMLGSVSHGVLHSAKCPVAIVR
ncbi:MULTISPECIES: universal stress protein [unclassified Yimella]|uniref:universal stress protein n=1 Tax=unclassified Yimella TaxID=2649892 RepID=UPI00101D841A|nr:MULTISPECIES: universal stress protein [unclassified Yimella]MCG8656049.1 universal stress protein [Yimella sp. NH-Cas1]RYG76654.1 universal stress protein [Yimella sp. RIT 621]